MLWWEFKITYLVVPYLCSQLAYMHQNTYAANKGIQIRKRIPRYIKKRNAQYTY